MKKRNNGRERSLRIGASFTAALLTVVLAMAPANADDLDDLQDQQEQNEQDRESVAAALEGTDTELAEAYLALDDINRRLPIAEQELVIAEEDLAAAERHLDEVQARLEVAEQQQADLEAEIAAGEEEIAATEEAMGAVARDAYRGGDGMTTLNIILGAGSAEEFAEDYSAMNSALRTQDQTLSELETLQAVNRNRQARLDAVSERIAELEVEAEVAVAEAEAARQLAADLVEEIRQLKVEQEAKAAELEVLREQYEVRQSELEAENDRITDAIEEEIAAIAAAEAERRAAAAAAAAANRPSSSGSSSSSSGSSSSSSGSSSSGGFISPVTRSLYVTSPYGMRWYPITGGYYMHRGVDLRSRCGEAQRSVASGTVVGVRPAAGNGTHGNQVLVNHGSIGSYSYVSVYNHLSRFAVKAGQRISQGQAIGYTGATGNVTGCHVHLELWRNGSTVNPLPYIS
ncbi:MAG: peptidoglycan DD-metalloendopeptidase family protein [Beutenbergiaceae bacterium]